MGRCLTRLVNYPPGVGVCPHGRVGVECVPKVGLEVGRCLIRLVNHPPRGKGTFGWTCGWKAL